MKRSSVIAARGGGGGSGKKSESSGGSGRRTQGHVWECDVCDFRNEGDAVACQGCGSDKPRENNVSASVALLEEERLSQHHFVPPTAVRTMESLSLQAPLSAASSPHVLIALNRRMEEALAGIASEERRDFLLEFVKIIDLHEVEGIFRALEAKYGTGALPIVWQAASQQKSSAEKAGKSGEGDLATRKEKKSTDGAPVAKKAKKKKKEDDDDDDDNDGLNGASERAPTPAAAVVDAAPKSSSSRAKKKVVEEVQVKAEEKPVVVKKRKAAPPTVPDEAASLEGSASVGGGGGGDAEIQKLYLVPSPASHFRSTIVLSSNGGKVEIRRKKNPRDVSTANVIFIEDQNVSNRHCSFHYDPLLSKFYVNDTSMNGVRVNDRRVRQGIDQEIRLGDRIVVATDQTGFVVKATDQQISADREQLLDMARARKSGMPKSSAAPSVPQTAAPPPGKKPQHINLVDDDDDDDDNNKGDHQMVRRSSSRAKSEVGSISLDLYGQIL